MAEQRMNKPLPQPYSQECYNSLTSCGFQYRGRCPSCGAPADRYIKGMGRNLAELKYKKSGAFTLMYRGSVTRGQMSNLDLILTKNGLKESPVQTP